MKNLILKNTSVVLILALFNLTFSCQVSAPELAERESLAIDLSDLNVLISNSVGAEGLITYSSFRSSVSDLYGDKVAKSVDDVFLDRSVSGRAEEQVITQEELLAIHENAKSELSFRVQAYINEMESTFGEADNLIDADLLAYLSDLSDQANNDPDLSGIDLEIVNFTIDTFTANSETLNDVFESVSNGRGEGLIGAIVGAIVGLIVSINISDKPSDAFKGDDAPRTGAMIIGAAILGAAAFPF